MLNDFIVADKQLKIPMYRQIYFSIRNLIENGSLKLNAKIPSIRKLSESLGVSKTTVTAAYDQLCAEGYISSKPQSGYFVAADFDNVNKETKKSDNNSEKEYSYCEFDFSGKSIDSKITDFAEWRKCVKDVINKNYLLTSYGDAQGEKQLREALQSYALGTRSVNSSPDNIVVAAGAQGVLNILCPLLGAGKRVALAKGSFVQAEFVFKSHGCEVCCFESDSFGATVESLDRIKPDFVLINPNFTGKASGSMPMPRRLEIIEWAKENNAYIIEDDYNGELRYSTHPMPCVQNYGVEHTVYIGSFSKVLLPSVRISYMVLPQRLMERYRDVKHLINQTASKTEQLALARYINSRKIETHLRKARRIYLEKSKIMLKYASKYFPGAQIIFNETSMYITIKFEKSFDRQKLESALEGEYIRIMPHTESESELGLSYSGIAAEKIEDGLKRLCSVIASQ